MAAPWTAVAALTRAKMKVEGFIALEEEEEDEFVFEDERLCFFILVLMDG